MKFANEVQREKALKELEQALNKEIPYCYIGGTLGIGDHGYTLKYIDDPEVRLAAAKVFLNSKSEHAHDYGLAKSIVEGEGK